MKPDAATLKLEPTEIHPGLWKIKVPQGKALLKIGVEKKHGDANSLFLEVNSSRKFEIGNDCDTCHFWFKCLSTPRLSTQKKFANLPKTISMPRPLDVDTIQELQPMLDILEKGEYYLFSTTVRLSGPYASDDESSYFFNNEFLEIWNIEDPAQEGLLSEWEHFEGAKPRLFRHNSLMEKQFDFVIPLIPRRQLKEDYIKLYQQMIAAGDRPRILALGMLQRAIPQSVLNKDANALHSFFASFVLDGHHKLAAYRRADVAVPILVLLSQKASKYALLKEEGANARQKFEERLASLAV